MFQRRETAAATSRFALRFSPPLDSSRHRTGPRSGHSNIDVV